MTFGTNGAYTYTPTAGYDGPDSYTFTAVAGGAGEDSTVGTVNFTVNEVNDLTLAPPANTVNENSSVTGNVLTGAVDSDGPHSGIAVTAGTFSTTHGSITIAANGAYTYTPTAGYDGADSHTFTAVAGGAGEDSTVGTVNFTVNEVNDLTLDPQSV